MADRTRFILTTDASEVLPHLEELSQTYRLPFGRAQRYGIKGVRTSHIDVLIQCTDAEIRTPCIEVSERSYAGSGQWRLTVREYHASRMGDCLPVTLHVTKHGDEHGAGAEKWRDGRCIVELHDTLVGERVWCWSGQYFTEVVDNWWGIYEFHWKKFYPFLGEQDVIDHFGGDVLPTEATLNQANRFVSRSLYALARSLGYRRISNRKSEYFQKWQHETRGLVEFNVNGCGAATNAAAVGLPVEMTGRDGD